MPVDQLLYNLKSMVYIQKSIYKIGQWNDSGIDNSTELIWQHSSCCSPLKDNVTLEFIHTLHWTLSG